MIRTGTSNIVLPITKAQFPEEFKKGSRLGYYSSLFNTVEVNSTFYKIPRSGTLLKWTSEVPDDFRFTVKMNKDITHARQLLYDPALVQRFMQTIDAFGEYKGCLLIQLPASATAIWQERFYKLLLQICSYDSGCQWKKCIEFRHNSWYQPAVYEMLDALNIAVVMHDMPGSAIQTVQSDAPYAYLRFHGTEPGYRGNYSREILKNYAVAIREWVKAGKEVYVYFNNTLGEAFVNAQCLQELLNQD